MARKRKSHAIIPDSVMEPYAAPAPRDPVSMDRLVEEGMVIARHAVTMAVKNAGLVGVLRDDEQFDAEVTQEIVRDELGRIAEEQSAHADRMADELDAVSRRPGTSTHAHDYRGDDAGTLERRAKAYRLLAEELAAKREDEAFLAELTESVRQSMWGDVSEAIETRMTQTHPPEPDEIVDGLTRAERLAQFVDFDLPLLAAHHTVDIIEPQPHTDPTAVRRKGFFRRWRRR